MVRNILDYLENSADVYGSKIAFADEEASITFSELKSKAESIGSAICSVIREKVPIPVFMKKSANEIAAFMGVVYSGNAYVPIDPQMPIKRIEKIIATLKADIVITDEECRHILEEVCFGGQILLFQDVQDYTINHEALRAIRRRSIDCDLLYVIFTSGSTGDPKGVALSHRAVIDFTEWFTAAAHFDSSCIFGSQAPFYFDMSVKDIYSTLKNGATTFIIPKRLFNFPVELFQYITDNNINTLAWATSAVCLAAKEEAFKRHKPKSVRAVCFGGEAMPVKLLDIWRRQLPDAMFMNMYGPTETAVDCTYYIVEKGREYTTPYLPAGHPCENTDIIILNGDKSVKENEVGEICVRGTALAMGYYNNPEKTAGVFVQNPLQNAYPELIYRTGDIGYFNADGEIMFASRKDDQIKHMGYRIELGEIEAALSEVGNVERCCVLFDKAKDKIICVYTGTASKKDIVIEISKYIPKYMWPNVFVQLDAMPLNLNGKIDRVKLKEEYVNG